MRVNQRLVAEVHPRVLVHAAGDVLHARQILESPRASASVSVAADAEAGFEVAQPLAGERVIVLLHRIVFGMERRPGADIVRRYCESGRAL